MVETRPRLLAEFMLLSFLLCEFGFRHGSSDTTTQLHPHEDSDTNNLKIKCTGDCVHDKNRYHCHVKEFSFTSAALTGSIPKEVEELKHLEKLDLSGNQLSGSIPNTLWNLSALKEFDLSSNKLTGSIPDTLWNLSSLVSLDLSRNQLAEGISERIGHLRNLTYL
ncbi:LRR receptor-like serine/threonine-protein kinase FEI 2 [Prunus avium]|uniref:LRR receptor-like serine/threonine-protein kinase FEI 2 n=1 Tax=Prunus avium TaxID=42229 RepID=A0A6P5U0P0_PRUAV|nr:LRR receptor-like serine/threonine-protein kinase FEI 2 [Prunus avium]